MADVGIAGAGLAGPLLAVYLSRRGHDVTLYERRPDPRLAGAAGRSINLALSARGIDALERVGLAEDVMGHGLAMRGRMMHDRSGQLAYQAYSADGSKAINSISRHGLNGLLLDAAAKEPGVVLHFEERAAVVVAETGELTLEGPSGRHTVTHEVVIGADGAYSAMREAVVRSERADYRQEHLPWGYKELTIAPDASGGFALDPGALHIWPRGDSMMIALPNPDRSFTATLFWPFEGDAGFAGLDTPDAVRARFDRDYPDATSRFEDLAGEFARNPVGSLVTVRVWPWVRGRLGLLGDAAHAIVPFFGQGMNCAFEDVVELDRCLGETGDDWPAAARDVRRAAQAQRRRHRRARARQLRGDAGQGRLAGLPSGQAGRARHRAVGAGPLRLPVRAGELHDRPLRGGPAPGRGAAPVPGQRRRARRGRRGPGHRGGGKVWADPRSRRSCTQ